MTPVAEDLSDIWRAAYAQLAPAEVSALNGYRQSVALRRDGDRVVLETSLGPERNASWPQAEAEPGAIAGALRGLIPLLHDAAGRNGGLRAGDVVGVPVRTLADYGVVLDADGDQDPAEWRVLVEGPVLLMTSSTGLHGRGYRYLVGLWPGPGAGQTAVVALALVKLYATGGREGVVFLTHYGNDVGAAIRAVNTALAGAQSSPRLTGGYQPDGNKPLDEEAVLTALRRHEFVAGPGWDDLDAATLRAYGGKPPDGWCAAGEPCVMKYTRWHNLHL